MLLCGNPGVGKTLTAEAGAYFDYVIVTPWLIFEKLPKS